MIVAGFGFRRGVGLDSLRDALRRAAKGHRVSGIATLADKATETGFQELAMALDLPVHGVSPEAVADVDTATKSRHVQAARGTGSVAEATALVAVGAGGRLVRTRVLSRDRMASCALAEAGPTGEKP